jgi:hypothetical protein
MQQRSRTEPTLASASSICTLRVALLLTNPHSATHYWQLHAFPYCANRTTAGAPHGSYNQRTDEDARTLARRCASC